MANPKIEVEIGAQTDGLNKGLNESQSSIDKFAKKIELLNAQFKQNTNSITALEGKISTLKTKLESATNVKSIEKYQSQLDNAQNKLIQLGQIGSSIQGKISLANQQASQSFGGLTKSVGSANGVAVEFSRIIQDSPFGIIGIGNNIQQLTANFAQLRSQTTSTGAALSSALGALISPANLLVLGISAVTAGFTAYQMGAFKSKEETRDLAKELEDYRSGLEAVSKAQLEGSINAQKEIGTLSELRSQAQNTALSSKVRLEAVRDLKKEYPEYLGNLTDEQILTGKVGNAYDNLAKSLLETAKARASTGIIIKNFEEILTLESQQITNADLITKAREKVARLEASAQTSASNALAINGQVTAQNTDLIRAKEELNDLLLPQIERGNQVNKLTSENIRLNGQINTSLEAGGKFTETQVGSVKSLNTEAEKLLRTFTTLADLPTIGLPRTGDVEALRARYEELKAGGQTQLTPQQGLDQAIQNAPGISSIKMGEGFSGEKLEELKAKLEEQAPAIQTIVSQLGDAFSSLGGQIANSLNIGNDALKGFVSTLLSSTPKIIQAIFQQVAAKKAASLASQAASQGEAAGNAIASATSAASALGPLGLALLPVFIGGALALVSKAFGKGGGGSGGGSVGAGVSSQSFGGSGFSSNAMNLNGEFTVRGTDLVYVLNRVQDKNAKG